MGKIKSFKQEFSFDERLEESKNIIGKYPDRVPVIIERYSRTDLPEMEKKKYLVPRDMSVGQFIHICRQLIVRDAKALCPQLVIFPYDFEVYEEVADQFHDILVFSGFVEDLGLTVAALTIVVPVVSETFEVLWKQMAAEG